MPWPIRGGDDATDRVRGTILQYYFIEDVFIARIGSSHAGAASRHDLPSATRRDLLQRHSVPVVHRHRARADLISIGSSPLAPTKPTSPSSYGSEGTPLQPPARFARPRPFIAGVPDARSRGGGPRRVHVRVARSRVRRDSALIFTPNP
jgi:hypothetical protein